MAFAGNTVEKVAGCDSQTESGTSSQDDKELVDCLRKGENRCYEIFVRRFGPKVLAVSRRYLKSEADAADCFQDTFVAAFNSIDRFEQRSSLGTWLRGITTNNCLMRIRSNSRRREESIDHLLPEFDERGSRINAFEPQQSESFGEQIDESQTKALVREKINELPDDYRVILLLRDIDGNTTQETADILGIKTNAVKTRLHRARSALKSLLEPELERLK